MKTLKDVCKNLIRPCDPNQEITHIMVSGEQIPFLEPVLAQDVFCLECQGKEGFYIPHRQTWSCLNPICMEKNTKPAPSKATFFESSSCMFETTPNSFSDCKQTPEVIKIFRDFSKANSGFLLLSGWNGTGKTFAANCISNAIPLPSSEKYFISQADLNQQWLNETRLGDIAYLTEKFSKKGVLVLDDLGTRNPSEAFMDFLYAIVDKRYSEKRTTIITTNLNSKALREKFGDAFTSRVASGLIVKLEGNDRRFKDF